MSGLLGFLGGDKAALDRMLRAPAARGRVEKRARLAPLVVFGPRDVDLSEDEDRREALGLVGYARLRGRPVDAAKLLAAWRRRGEDVLRDMTGEYTLAVILGSSAFVARDALGTRPMYVAELPSGTAFSTSLFALIHAGADPAPDRDAIARSLVLGFPTAPGTAVAQIRQLGPGEVWQIAPRRKVTRWFVPRERLDRARTLPAAVRAVDRAVTTAVENALPEAGRVGAFLSGGIDSSLILARVHESGTPVESYTLSFGDDYPTELRYARAVAGHLGVRQHVLTVDARRFVDAIPEATDHLEDVVSETIAIPNFLLAREAARSVDVLFTGEGGDQSFGGPKNVGMALAYAYGTHPAAPPLPQTWLSLFHYFWTDLDRALDPDLLRSFDRERLAEDALGRFLGKEPARGQGSFVGRVMLANTVVKGGQYILVKVAKVIGLAHDLMLRSPLYDRRLVELALTIPPWQKLDGTSEKLVFRQAALRSLPRWVIDRPKRGMMVPLAPWFGRELGALARDVLTERTVKNRGILRWPYVERLLAHALPSREPSRAQALHQLWLVLMTELHHRSIDAAAAESRCHHVAPSVLRA